MSLIRNKNKGKGVGIVRGVDFGLNQPLYLTFGSEVLLMSWTSGGLEQIGFFPPQKSDLRTRTREEKVMGLRAWNCENKLFGVAIYS